MQQIVINHINVYFYGVVETLKTQTLKSIKIRVKLRTDEVCMSLMGNYSTTDRGI